LAQGHLQACQTFASQNIWHYTKGASLRFLCFVQTGSLLLNAISPSQVTIQVPQSLTGFNTVLNASSLTTTPVAAGAGCVYIAFASSAPVDAFLSTYDDFVSLVTDR
jgi:hypothetical protein